MFLSTTGRLDRGILRKTSPKIIATLRRSRKYRRRIRNRTHLWTNPLVDPRISRLLLHSVESLHGPSQDLCSSYFLLSFLQKISPQYARMRIFQEGETTRTKEHPPFFFAVNKSGPLLMRTWKADTERLPKKRFPWAGSVAPLTRE